MWTYIVDNIKFVLLPFSPILNTEIKPLSVSFGINIILHQQIIFVFRSLEREKQISALKPWLKN